MAEPEKKPVSLNELMVSTLAMTDAAVKLLIEKGIITEAEFKQKLLEERVTYQRILNPSAVSAIGSRAASSCLWHHCDRVCSRRERQERELLLPFSTAIVS